MNNYIGLVEASRLMRGRRRGQGPHVDTLRRWSNKGYFNPMTAKTIHLKTAHVSGQLLTTQEWVEEFERDRHARPVEPVLRTAKQATRAQKRAGDRLDKAGI